MNKKYLLLVGLLPLFYSCANKTNVINQINYEKAPTIESVNEDSDACTVMYVGDDLTTNHLPIIARSSDAGPGAMMLNTQIFPHNALAKQTVTGKNGFAYIMPSTTYRYISTPRNPIVHKGHHWEASAINENGVGVSATLSCYANSDAKAADPFVTDGISEDNIAQILGATATSARNGIETLGDIIDKKGSSDANAVMVIDQKEAWYMEIYTGHQYAAIKLPSNKVLTAGNEFVFDSLNEMGITNKDDMFLSHDLYTLPTTKGFAKPQGCASVKDLDLFDTYATPFVGTGDKRIDNDNYHRRTWRGINLFAKTKYPGYETYSSTQKYPALYDADDNLKLDIHEVTRFMRDRFENILDPEQHDPNYENFKKDADEHHLRYIGIENAYQIHIIQSDPSLPEDMAATEWLSISNANYTPFVPINNAIGHMSDYYSHVSTTYEYDDKSAANIFKKLNALASDDRTNYGINVEEFWKKYETIWDKEYADLIQQVKDLDANSRNDILTNYVTRTQDMAVKTALFMIDDLTWHIMSDKSSYGNRTPFNPCVNVKDYAQKHGYLYEKHGDTIRFGKDNYEYTLILNQKEFDPDHNKQYRSTGTITYGDIVETIEMVIKDQDVYVPYITLSEYIRGDVVINMNEYRTPFNHAVWIIPVTIAIPIAAGLTYYFISKKRKKIEDKASSKYNY